MSLKQIRIISHSVDGSGRGFYTVRSNLPAHHVVVNRHFSDFRKLHVNLGRSKGMVWDLEWMGRLWMNGGEETVMTKRQELLNLYLVELRVRCGLEDGGKLPEQFVDFLGIREDMKIRRKHRKSLQQSTSLAKTLTSTPTTLRELNFLLRLVFGFSFFLLRLLRAPFAAANTLLFSLEQKVRATTPPTSKEEQPSIPTTEDVFDEYEVIEKISPNADVGQVELESESDLMSTDMTPAARELYSLIEPVVQKANKKSPLYVIPPGAVKSFEVEIPGDEPTILIELYGKYQRFINDYKEGVGEVVFDVTFMPKIRGTFVDGCLINLEGVLAKRLPLTIQAKVVKMILPSPGGDKVTFVAKAGFLPKISLPIKTEHFKNLEKWEGTKKISS